MVIVRLEQLESVGAHWPFGMSSSTDVACLRQRRPQYGPPPTGCGCLQLSELAHSSCLGGCVSLCVSIKPIAISP